jgi:hypothetical protein
MVLKAVSARLDIVYGLGFSAVVHLLVLQCELSELRIAT